MFKPKTTISGRLENSSGERIIPRWGSNLSEHKTPSRAFLVAGRGLSLDGVRTSPSKNALRRFLVAGRGFEPLTSRL